MNIKVCKRKESLEVTNIFNLSHFSFKNQKSYLYFFFKLIGITIIVYFILKKITLDQIVSNLENIKFSNIVLALIALNLSYLISGIRLKLYLASKEIIISTKDSVILFYRGLFLNNFLPAGIGGDAYKILYFKKHGYSATKIIQAVLSDRASGLLAIITVIGVLLPYINLAPNYEIYSTLINNKLTAVILLTMVLIVYRLGSKWLCHEKLSTSYLTFWLSLFIQLCVTFAQMCLLENLNIQLDNINYVWLTLVSFISLVLPITIGSTGIRELTAIFLANFIVINTELAISGFIAHFILTLCISFFASLSFLVKLTLK